MSSDNTKILEFNQYQKSNKAPFNIYADLGFIKEKIDGCRNNPKFVYKKSKQTYSIKFFNVYNIFA